MSFHDARKSAALAGPDHIDSLYFGELTDRYGGADFQLRIAAKFANETLRFAVSLGDEFDAGVTAILGSLAVQLSDVSAFGATCQATGLIFEAHLDSLITVSLLIANLKHMTWAGLDYGHWDRTSVFQVNLCHPDFAAED
jgi:hypothetical protein